MNRIAERNRELRSLPQILKSTWFALAFWTAMIPISRAQTFTQLAVFTDGTTVASSLVQGRDGSFYGTSNNGGRGGYGTVFKVTSSRTLTTLHHFCSQPNCADGFYPFSTLVLGTDGNFYGTTQNGGAGGVGVVFKITASGAYSVLHSFATTDGSSPDAGLALGADKNFYGTTALGGTASGCVGGCGTIFKMTPSGTLTTLHSFNFRDGFLPMALLILGFDGDLYGTASAGGEFNSRFEGYKNCGTVFKTTTSGELLYCIASMGLTGLHHIRQ